MALTLTTLAPLAVSPSFAQAPAETFEGKRINLIVSFNAGGTYGIYGRLVAENISRHLPGSPTIIVQHMPGAGGIVATNHLYNLAPKDGTTVGMLLKDIALTQIISPETVRYDARKFNWIGSVNQYYSIVMTWSASGANSIDAARKREVIMASSGAGHQGTILAQAMNEILGTRFRSITGYDNAGAMHMAMERGEVHGRIGSWESIKTGQANWIRDKKIDLIIQSGFAKARDLPDVPLLLDLVKDPADRAVLELIDSGSIVGWSVTLPPEVSAARVAAWRTAFDAMIKDPIFLAAAKKLNVDVEAKSGSEVAGLMDRVLGSNPEVFERTRKISANSN